MTQRFLISQSSPWRGVSPGDKRSEAGEIRLALRNSQAARGREEEGGELRAMAWGWKSDQEQDIWCQ